MAILRSSGVSGDPNPKISFFLDLLGFMRYSEGSIDRDWYETRLGIEIFGTKVERPDPNIFKRDVENLIGWLRDLVKATSPARPFFTEEPMFTITAEPIAGPTFLMRILIQAWGTVPGFFSEEEGVSVLLPVSADSVLHFSKHLQEEMAEVGRSQSLRRKLFGR